MKSNYRNANCCGNCKFLHDFKMGGYHLLYCNKDGRFTFNTEGKCETVGFEKTCAGDRYIDELACEIIGICDAHQQGEQLDYFLQGSHSSMLDGIC